MFPAVSPERWQQVKALLAACLEKPAGDRVAHLNSICTDPDIRAEVASLLEAHDEADRFLEDRTPRGREIATALDTDPLAGRRVGPYRLAEEIGRGGMGTVYRAVRDDDEFQRVVAVKIVSRGMDTDVVLRRFRTERQILASLDHPHIARLLDGGTTDGGLPYFVMEYVQGLTLGEYCDRNRLSISERIRLFRKVCEAVSYAHHNLVVHRDLKPGNILVTEEGIPKLLDFGIAKILKGGPDTSDPFQMPTMTQNLATPAYASPEQIRGGRVGVASDVYSLAVILYELLTGHSPYRLPMRDSPDLARIICEREPTRASTVITYKETIEITDDFQWVVDPTEVCENRSTTLDALKRRLRGEMDNILSMALDKDPTRRYASVEQFSEDLRRHLEGLPVVARKDTFGYRTSKFLSRHRLGVAFGAAAMLALSISAGVAVWKAQQLSKRISADHQLATSFVVEVHDQIAKLPGSTPAREALLQRSLEYLNGLAKDAGNDAGLQGALALAYEKFSELQAGTAGPGLGRSTAALETCMKAQAIRETLARDEPQNRTRQYELAANYLLASFLTGRTGSAVKRTEYDRKALAISETLVSAEPANARFQALHARSLTSLAYGLTFSDKWQEANKYLQQALAIRAKVAESQPESFSSRRSLATIHYRLGTTHTQAGQPAQALDYLRQALSMQQALASEEPENQQIRSDMAATYHFLGVATGALGDTRKALEHFDQAVTLRTAQLANDPRDIRSRSMLAGNYSEKATVQLRAGDSNGALMSIRKAVDLQEEAVDADPKAVPTRMSLADQSARLATVHVTLAEQARGPMRDHHWARAADYYRRSLELFDKLGAEGHMRSPVVVADAERVRQQLERCERELGRR